MENVKYQGNNQSDLWNRGVVAPWKKQQHKQEGGIPLSLCSSRDALSGTGFVYLSLCTMLGGKGKISQSFCVSEQGTEGRAEWIPLSHSQPHHQQHLQRHEPRNAEEKKKNPTRDDVQQGMI